MVPRDAIRATPRGNRAYNIARAAEALRSPEPRSGLVEVTVGVLSRSTSRVVGELRDGQRMLVTRHGAPIGSLLPLGEAVRHYLLGFEEIEEVEARMRDRDMSRLLHGRWRD